MVRGELLSLNNQRFAAFLADQNDRDLACVFVDIEENSVPSEESKLTLREGVGA
jgi:hypothetical protein